MADFEGLNDVSLDNNTRLSIENLSADEQKKFEDYMKKLDEEVQR
jgi:coenzyme F420-reducing hydrogenase delta subunit